MASRRAIFRSFNTAEKLTLVAGGLYGFADEAKNKTKDPSPHAYNLLLAMTVFKFVTVEQLFIKRQPIKELAEKSSAVTMSYAFIVTGAVFGANFYIGNQVGRLALHALHSL